MVFLMAWFYIFNQVFINKDALVGESPALRVRLGTILWHSSDTKNFQPINNLSTHIYCYYPKSQAVYDNKGGEYIIKKVEDLKECRDWYGSVILNEGVWVSEREKIWWSQSQKLGDDLVALDKPLNTL